MIANNQVGFTTDPAEGRSTRYSSDLAKGFDVPIVHVNADDPEAALAAIRLALAYREEFGHDVVVDLVGYRRFGHNEQDEAAYTQPLQAARIEQQPPVRESYAARLVAEGVLSAEEAATLLDRTIEVPADDARRAADDVRAARAADRGEDEDGHRRGGRHRRAGGPPARARPAARPRARRLRGEPEARAAARAPRARRSARAGSTGGTPRRSRSPSLLEDGIPIRLSGQDTERGTFSHRHAVLHDPVTGETHTPLQALSTAAASFEIYNSPLSEFAAVGFEHGYSIAAPDALVLWEAQFGDFVNGAQIVVDQFIVSGRSKWQQTSRLTLLLPHGYEGNGPEHSSARLERFLQLAAQDNIRVVNRTTAAQFFHLLRRQALDATARPLVVHDAEGPAPRSARRRRRSRSSRAGRSAPSSTTRSTTAPRSRGSSSAAGRSTTTSRATRRGRRAHGRGRARRAAVPVPARGASAAVVASYPSLREIVWAQEEPQNMGAWRSLRHRLDEAVAGATGVERVDYVGRPWRASPSEGYPTLHQHEQDRIVREALGIPSG